MPGQLNKYAVLSHRRVFYSLCSNEKQALDLIEKEIKMGHSVNDYTILYAEHGLKSLNCSMTPKIEQP